MGVKVWGLGSDGGSGVKRCGVSFTVWVWGWRLGVRVWVFRLGVWSLGFRVDG